MPQYITCDTFPADSDKEGSNEESNFELAV